MIPALTHLISYNFKMQDFVSSLEGLTNADVAAIKDTAHTLETIGLMFNSKPVYVGGYTVTEGARTVLFSVGALGVQELERRLVLLGHLTDTEKDEFVKSTALDQPVKASFIVAGLAKHEWPFKFKTVDDFSVELTWSN